MPHAYDASTKYLVDDRLADWLPLCGHGIGAPARVIDADLSTVTAQADRVLLVEEDPPWIMHVELQSSRFTQLPRRTHVYNGLLGHRHNLPVRSVLVLLRQAADGPELTGRFELGFAGEEPYHVFRYHVVRVWELLAEEVLAFGLGVLPLAPLSQVTSEDLPSLIREMGQRIDSEATPEEAGVLWTATNVLMGLRYPRTLIADLLKGVHGMRESVTYQAIVEEGLQRGLEKGLEQGLQQGLGQGLERGTRSVLLRIGTRLLGTPDEEIHQAIGEIHDPDRLTRMADRLPDVADWSELLETP